MADPTEPQAAPTEADEGLTEAERRRIEDWLHDNRWPEAYDLSHAIRPVVEQIIRDRQADTLETAADLRIVPGHIKEGVGTPTRAHVEAYAEWLRDRARTLRGER